MLREMEDLETHEIAAVLNCGESTVRNHLFNARRILRKEIERISPSLAGPTKSAAVPRAKEQDSSSEARRAKEEE